MRIAVVTQYYPPDPQWIPASLARGLLERGHEVRVLTTFPHYESGRVSHGFKQRWHHVRDEEGLLVRRVPIVASHSRNPVSRIANYLSFVWSTRRARSFVADCDVVYVYATPMTVAAAPLAWARALGLPYVLHVQDVWPESVTRSGFLKGPINRLAEWGLSRWLTRVYAQASRVIVIAPRMASMLIERGVEGSKVGVVLNWCDGEPPVIARSTGTTSDGLSLVYAGNLGRMQEVHRIVEAVASLAHLPGLVLRIAGSGVEEPRLRDLASALEPGRIEFLGRLRPAEVPQLLEQADYQLVTLRNLPIFEGTLPSKFTNGLALGIPTLTNVPGDVSEIVSSGGMGIVALPDSTRSLAEAIEAAYRTSPQERQVMAQNARDYYDHHMSRANGVAQIESALAEAVKANRKERV